MELKSPFFIGLISMALLFLATTFIVTSTTLDTVTTMNPVTNNNITVGMLNLNITQCTDTDSLLEGTLCWNPDQATLNVVRGNGQVIQVGKELGDDGINKDTVSLADGTVVYMSGITGDNPEFKRADGSNISESAFVGVLTTVCEPNELCPVTVFGFVNNVDTSMWSAGDKLYLDPNVNGNLTNIVPTLPNNPIWIATVVRVSATVGSIFVNPQIDPNDGFLINNIWSTGNITTNCITLEDGFQYCTLATTYYNATSYELVTGTVTGNLNYTQHLNGAYDDITFNITERVTAPALDIRFNFTDGITEFTQGIIRYSTSSITGNHPLIQIWDYDASAWEDYGELDPSTSFVTIQQSVFDSSDHVQNGTVQMRLYKSSTGNINNEYYIDWLAIAKGFGVPAPEEIDPIWSNEKGNYFTSSITNSTGLIGKTCSNEQILEFNTGTGKWECGTDSTGTDDQTLQEVLTQGNTATLNINTTGNVSAYNYNNVMEYNGFVDTSLTTQYFRIGQIPVGTEQKDAIVKVRAESSTGKVTTTMLFINIAYDPSDTSNIDATITAQTAHSYNSDSSSDNGYVLRYARLSHDSNYWYLDLEKYNPNNVTIQIIPQTSNEWEWVTGDMSTSVSAGSDSRSVHLGQGLKGDNIVANSAGSATYSAYMGAGGYTLSDNNNKTGKWEYFGYFRETYSGTYLGGHSANYIVWLSEQSRNIKNASDLEYIRLDMAVTLDNFANSGEFNSNVPSLDIKVYGNTTLTGDDFACLVYSSTTSAKVVRCYVKLKDEDTHYTIMAMDRYGQRYTTTGGRTTDSGFVYASNQAVITSLPSPAQGSIQYGTKITYVTDKQFNDTAVLQVNVNTTQFDDRINLHINETYMQSLVDLSAYVPYTGATTNVDLGGNDLTVGETNGDAGNIYVHLGDEGGGEYNTRISGGELYMEAEGSTLTINPFSTDGYFNNHFTFFGENYASIGTYNLLTLTGSPIKLVGNLQQLSDSNKIYFGAGNDASIGYDGTNLIFNTSLVGSGIAYFSDNVSAEGFVDRTYVTNTTDKEAYELLQYVEENFYVNGIKNHSVWGECYVPINITDKSRPEIEYYESEVYNRTTRTYENITLNRTIYPYTTTDDGVDMGCKQVITQKAYNYLTQAGRPLETSDGKMLLDTELISAEQILTESKVPEIGFDYCGAIMSADVYNKSNHYAYLEISMSDGTKRYQLDSELRDVYTEGCEQQKLTEMCIIENGAYSWCDEICTSGKDKNYNWCKVK